MQDSGRSKADFLSSYINVNVKRSELYINENVKHSELPTDSRTTPATLAAVTSASGTAASSSVGTAVEIMDLSRKFSVGNRSASSTIYMNATPT